MGKRFKTDENLNHTCARRDCISGLYPMWDSRFGIIASDDRLAFVCMYHDTIFTLSLLSHTDI